MRLVRTSPTCESSVFSGAKQTHLVFVFLSWGVQTVSEWQPASVIRTMAVNAGVRVLFIFVPFREKGLYRLYIGLFGQLCQVKAGVNCRELRVFEGSASVFSVFFVEGRYGVERILEGCVEKIKDFCKKKVDGRSIA